ncbi:MAG TPA: polymer-forming cytoskeletal protein [Chitinophagaceae bacterium]|nr:polymer-forming cytoskeletal protein [Chitinophagaceae bacterium]
MFNKDKNVNGINLNGNSATLISAGTTLNGDVASETDLRIDGTIKGNVICSAKIIIGTTGIIEGNITGLQADISGKVIGNVEVKELLQMREESNVEGNIMATKLQVEPSAILNGRCQMQVQTAKPKKENELKKPEAILYQ